MAHLLDIIYEPNPEAHQVYMVLYKEYKKLYSYFGRGANLVMQRLRTLRHTQQNRSIQHRKEEGTNK